MLPHLILCQTSPDFYVSAILVFENTEGKGEIARNDQFLLYPQCFLIIWRTFCHFHQILNCRLQILSVWKSLKFVVWERVKELGITAKSLRNSHTRSMTDNLTFNTFPKQQNFVSSKLKEFVGDNFRFDENGRKIFDRKKTLWEKEKQIITNSFSFSHNVFKRLVLQTS